MYPSVLFIGGTGTISSACVAEAVSLGYDVTVLNRGQNSPLRPLPLEVHTVKAPINEAFDAIIAAVRQ